MKPKKISKREEIKIQDQWDLKTLFKKDQDWESLYLKIEKEIKKYDSFRGKLGSSFKKFKAALDFDLFISRKIEALYTYAHLKSDQDKSNQFYLGLYEKARNLYGRVSELSSFMVPEIQALPGSKFNSFLENPDLKEYQFFLKKIIRYKPHTSSPEVEKIMAMSSEISQTASVVFNQLDNVDLKFGMLEDEEQRKIELSHANFNSFLINKSRKVRAQAFRQYYQAYQQHQHTMAATLASSVKKDFFYAKSRKFKTCREAALFSDKINLKVYDNLLVTVKRNLNPFYKYLGFRKKVLKVKELHFYDTYVPLVKEIDFKMSYQEAVQVCLKALAPLGEEYITILKKGLEGGWVDKYENIGKRSGAYSSGCYDSPPYILLNYDENNINSLYTLIHEAGHSMHSYYAQKNQFYLNYNYTIFVAEVASTFNETLLSKYLLDFYKEDKNMVSYILNREIDNIRGTLFRQTMFAEFEKNIHEIVEQNKPLTLEVLLKEYQDLLKLYLGPSVKIDKELLLECLRIPHFYSAFYVYKYATGISAAIALANQVLTKGWAAREKYLSFLKSGGSKFPLEQLKEAGVNMSSPKPIEEALKYFADLVKTFIKKY